MLVLQRELKSSAWISEKTLGDKVVCDRARVSVGSPRNVQNLRQNRESGRCKNSHGRNWQALSGTFPSESLCGMQMPRPRGHPSPRSLVLITVQSAPDAGHGIRLFRVCFAPLLCRYNPILSTLILCQHFGVVVDTLYHLSLKYITCILF